MHHASHLFFNKEKKRQSPKTKSDTWKAPSAFSVGWASEARSLTVQSESALCGLGAEEVGTRSAARASCPPLHSTGQQHPLAGLWAEGEWTGDQCRGCMKGSVEQIHPTWTIQMQSYGPVAALCGCQAAAKSQGCIQSRWVSRGSGSIWAVSWDSPTGLA